MVTEWWVNLTFACCWIAEKDGVIVDAAPILRKFVGQPIDKLIRWKQFIERKQIG